MATKKRKMRRVQSSKPYIPRKGPNWNKGLYTRVRGHVGYDRTTDKQEVEEIIEEQFEEHEYE